MVKYRVGLLAAFLFQAAYAEGSPVVTVTVKNQSTLAVVNKSISANHQHTLMNAYPKPKSQINPGEEDTYSVDNKVGNGANYAEVNYTMGEKSCNFKSLFLNKMVGYKTYSPQWLNYATPQNGASCSAETVSIDSIVHSWHVVFIIK